MAYLEKACTIDTLHLVYASVQDKFNKSIKGYAYLKIPARKFLQTLSEKHRTNPKIYHENGSKITVNFPVLGTDKYQPEFVMNWEKIRKTMIKWTVGLFFAPLESLQMAGFSGRMSKAGFHFQYVCTILKGSLITLWILWVSFRIVPTCQVVGFLLKYCIGNFSKTEYEIRKIFMLVPKTPDSQVRRRDLPTITEKPTVYDYTQTTSTAVSQQDDEWLSLDNATGTASGTVTPANALLSAPSVHNILSMPTHSNPIQSNEQTLSRDTMPNFLLQKLRKKNCTLATRQYLFENSENILPFRITYPQDYPQENQSKLQTRLNWVRNSLTKNALGEFQSHSLIS